MKKNYGFTAFRVAILSLTSFACAPWADAQVETGRFVGRITDPQGAVVPNATITVANLGTNLAQTAHTNADGDFIITPVQGGMYRLTVSAAGFETNTISSVEVQVGQIVREDLTLKIGAETTTVEVQSTAPLLSTDSATVSQVITNEQLVDLPLNGRGFYKLAQLTPGAALLPPTGNSLAIRPETVDGNTISGIKGRAISFLLDGVDTSEQHQGGTFAQVSVDALQEFSVQQNPYSAEFNRGGGFFNSTTKSGTNKFHGGVFEFIRNDKLDARNYFATTRQILKRNQFGGTFGGPLSIPHLYSGRDRSFFFLSYEAQRLRQGLVFNLIVPTDAQRAGDFSASGLKAIYDPLTTKTTNGVTTRTQFPGNKINRPLSPQALAILNYYPRGINGGGTAAFTPSQAIDLDQFTVRIDHQLSKANRLFGRWFYTNDREVDPNAAPALGTASLTSHGQDIAVGLVTTIGSNKVQDFRMHYLPSIVRLTAFLQGPDFNTTNGITGFQQLLRPGTSGSFPDFAFSGYQSLQGSTFDQRPKAQDRKVVEGTDNFTWIKGRHAMKFGTLIRYYQWIGYDSQTSYVGNFAFNGAVTQNPASPTGSGDAFADFLLGYPSSVGRAYAADYFGGQRTYYQFYGQDDIRVNDRLTVNIGLRYEYSPWMNGYKGQVGTFDPSQSKPIIVASNTDTVDMTAQFATPAAMQYFGQYIQTSHQAGLPYSITYTDRTQFAPRVGLAWRPFGNSTVFRAGYGIFYEPEGTGGRVNLNTLPYRLAETVLQTTNVVPTRTLANFFLGSALGSAATNPTLAPSPTHMKMGSNQHWSFGVQQQVTQSTVFDVAYVGNHGVHLQGSSDFNDPAPGPGAVQARRPYPLFGSIVFQSQNQGSTYNSLQAKVQQRASHGLTLLVSYTWSKFLESFQSPSIGGNTGYEKSYSAFDVPQNFAFSMTYQVPVGKGQRFLGTANGFVNAALGGWQLQSIVVQRSGTPYTPIVSTDVANTGVGNQRPNQIRSGKLAHPTVSAWFDKTAYVVAPAFTYGQVRSNTLPSDNYRQYDASIFKNFKVTDTSVVSFRAEFFNLSNTTSFNAPNATINTAAGGVVTGTSVPSRDIQFALKYNF